MKRLLSSIVVLVIISLCVIPCYAYSDSDGSQVNYLYVEYDEFYGNREYYDELLLEGYAIIVNVGEEHADEEIARFTQGKTNIHELVPSAQRGTTRPTTDYNIHSNSSYSFTCNANYEYLYTNYKFYGCNAYLIDGFNEHPSEDLRIDVAQTSQGHKVFTVPALSSIYVHFATESASTRWYPMFYPPSRAYGYINCIGH